MANNVLKSTCFAAGTRYPGMYDPILLVEARDVVKLTRRIRREIRQLLPREAKTTQRK